MWRDRSLRVSLLIPRLQGTGPSQEPTNDRYGLREDGKGNSRASQSLAARMEVSRPAVEGRLEESGDQLFTFTGLHSPPWKRVRTMMPRDVRARGRRRPGFDDVA